MTKVLILKGDSYRAVGELFASRGYEVAFDDGTPCVADLVVFTGGSDVSPYIYGEEPAGARGCDPVRDEYEKAIFEVCKIKGTPMIGICRGGQLLNVLSGGRMIQDLGLISGDVDTFAANMFADTILRVDHHQGMLASESSRIMAWYEGHDNFPDYAIWYPSTLSLCFQPHPEWGHEGTERYFFELVDDHVVPRLRQKEAA